MTLCAGLRVVLVSLGAFSWLTLPTAGHGQDLIPAKDFYVTDGVVETVEAVGDSVYVGGHFTHVGPYTGPLAPVSISTGATIPGFPEANGWIFGLASDGAGGWFVGGDFTEIGGVAREHVAHILPDLTTDLAWDANADHRVHGFAVHGSTVYLHGYFSSIGGEPRVQLASVSLATGAVTTWNPSPTSGVVEDFYLDGDTLYVVGSFVTIGGEARDMAAFDLTTGSLTAFDPVITNNVLTVVARDGVVYVGGRFTTAGGSARSRLAAFDAATAAVLPWDPDVNSTVHDLALDDSTLFAGGIFAIVGGVYHPAIVEIDLATGAALNNIGGTTGTVLSLLVHGDELYVAGDFTNLDGQDRRYLGGFDLTTGDVLDTPAPLDVVTVMAASGDTLFAGGEFGAVNGVVRNRFAAFHASTLELLPFAPDFQNIVWSIKANAAEDTLYVSGRFVFIDGVSRDKVASFDLTTGTLTDFAPEVNGDVYDISVTDDLLYMGGTYSMVGASFRFDLASVDRVTGALTSWSPTTIGFINTITAWNDTIYVGGSFSAIGDSSRTNLAALDGTTGDVLGWGSNITLAASAEVESFFPLDHPSYPSGVIFIGGDFLNMGIGLRRGVAAVYRDTGNFLYGWNPFLGDSFECEIRDFALSDGLLYMAGDFDGVLSNESDGVAAVDVVTDEASDWIVHAPKQNAIAITDAMIFIGGSSTKVQGYYHTYLAAFRRDDATVHAPTLMADSGPALSVHPNHPNPFGSATTLSYDLPGDGPVRVVIYDVKGRRVAVLQDETQRAGRHTISWNGKDERGTPVATGVYFARVTAGGSSRSRKMVLLR